MFESKKNSGGLDVWCSGDSHGVKLLDVGDPIFGLSPHPIDGQAGIE